MLLNSIAPNLNIGAGVFKEGRLVWIAIEKYLPNPPSGNKPTPYHNSKLMLDPRFPEE